MHLLNRLDKAETVDYQRSELADAWNKQKDG